jgi:hypothetical protein
MKSFFETEEPRYRVMTVSPELLLEALMSPLVRESGAVRCLHVCGLPEGCKVQAVIWDEFARVFRFRLWHPSFDVVEIGNAIPELRLEFRAEDLFLYKENRGGSRLTIEQIREMVRPGHAGPASRADDLFLDGLVAEANEDTTWRDRQPLL